MVEYLLAVDKSERRSQHQVTFREIRQGIARVIDGRLQLPEESYIQCECVHRRALHRGLGVSLSSLVVVVVFIVPQVGWLGSLLQVEKQGRVKNRGKSVASILENY